MAGLKRGKDVGPDGMTNDAKIKRFKYLSLLFVNLTKAYDSVSNEHDLECLKYEF